MCLCGLANPLVCLSFAMREECAPGIKKETHEANLNPTGSLDQHQLSPIVTEVTYRPEQKTKCLLQ